MKLASLEAIVGALNDAGVRYLVAGGLAVNAYGYIRFTYDVDLVVRLDRDNVLPAFRALGELGYQPTVPVTAEGFADPATRRQWITEKRMMVLNFQSARHRDTPIDVFVTEPFDFDVEYRVAREQLLAPTLPVRFVSIPTLIAMKAIANRPRDVDDIQHLRWLIEEERATYHPTR